MTTYLLGIDSGTSVVKSVVFDRSGHEIAIARREMPVVSTVTDGSEVDMRAVWQLTAETIAEVVREVGADSIAAVGISGTACGVWAIDEAGEPVRDAILWNDGRAADVLTAWQKNGVYQRIFEVSGNAAFPGYPLCSLRWVAEHEPETLRRARWIFFHKDWLRYCLTGSVHTDESDVAYFSGDIRTRGYSPELLEAAGLDGYAHCLPEVSLSEAIVGQVSAQAAALTGLREGTPVAAGAVDVVASVLGGGVYRAGQACSVLGTSFLNTLVSASPSFDPPDTGVQACMPGGLWARSLVNTSGTICIEWMIQTLLSDDPGEQVHDAAFYAQIEALAELSPPGARGLIFLPYLNSAGIISPFSAPAARGLFFGLDMNHRRADMVRAVYEGTALAMRDCFAVMQQPVDEVVLVGGGARSGFWAQLFADASGKHILIPEGTEFGARGVALLAGVGAGIYPSLANAIETAVRPARVYHPQPERTRVYDALYPLYRQLYLQMPESWNLRREIMRTLAT